MSQAIDSDYISIYLDIMNKVDAILALSALAQDTRLDTFRLLAKHEPEGIPAGELARLAGVPQNTMSSHLAILSRSNLVTGERQSRSIIYRANIQAFQALTLFMIQDCCGGHPELCGPIVDNLSPCCPTPKVKRSRPTRSKGAKTLA